MDKTINTITGIAIAAIFVAVAASIWTDKSPNQLATETGAKISESYKKMKEKLKLNKKE